jgi:hypothetical protein
VLLASEIAADDLPLLQPHTSLLQRAEPCAQLTVERNDFVESLYVRHIAAAPPSVWDARLAALPKETWTSLLAAAMVVELIPKSWLLWPSLTTSSGLFSAIERLSISNLPLKCFGNQGSAADSPLSRLGAATLLIIETAAAAAPAGTAKLHDFCLTLPYGALVALGGIMGAILAGSKMSLIMGGGSGLLLEGPHHAVDV